MFHLHGVNLASYRAFALSLNTSIRPSDLRRTISDHFTPNIKLTKVQINNIATAARKFSNNFNKIIKHIKKDETVYDSNTDLILSRNIDTDEFDARNGISILAFTLCALIAVLFLISLYFYIVIRKLKFALTCRQPTIQPRQEDEHDVILAIDRHLAAIESRLN